ncbi:TetR/AcrR family transcriptional regulator [Alicyclobacillaceae bacterium I2511]|nr:TetR/AcrR family transcriptional regulator [Alicyclobacillaceae bacterium I2511]
MVKEGIPDRKQKILLVARESFAIFGYKGTTIDQIARMANVGKGTIYTFFSSKDQLFHSIVADLVFQVKEVAVRSLDPHRPFFENLHNSLWAALQFRKDEELLLQLTREVREFGTENAKAALKQVEDAIVGFIQRQLELGMETAQVRRCDARLTAFLLFKAYVALVREWNQEQSPLTDARIAESLQDLFTHGLEMRPL